HRPSLVHLRSLGRLSSRGDPGTPGRLSPPNLVGQAGTDGRRPLPHSKGQWHGADRLPIQRPVSYAGRGYVAPFPVPATAVGPLPVHRELPFPEGLCPT